MPPALALAANSVVPVNFVFWLGDHLDFSDHIRRFQALTETKLTAHTLSENKVEMMSGRTLLGAVCLSGCRSEISIR